MWYFAQSSKRVQHWRDTHQGDSKQGRGCLAGYPANSAVVPTRYDSSEYKHRTSRKAPAQGTSWSPLLSQQHTELQITLS